MVWMRKIFALVFLAFSFGLSILWFPPNGQSQTAFSETPLKLLIADKDDSDLSRQLTAYLASKHRITFMKETGSDEEVLRIIKRNISLGKAHAGLIIAPHLEQNLAEKKQGVISFKDDKNITGLYLDMQVQKFLLFAAALKKAEGTFQFDRLHTVLMLSSPVTAEPKKQYGSGIKYFFNFLGWIVFSVILNSIGSALFELNNQRIKMRNSIAPVSSIRFAAEHFAAQLTAVFFLLAVLITFAAVVYRNEIGAVPFFLYLLNTLVYTAVILSAVFTLNAVMKKGAVMGIVGSVLPMVLAFISGVIIEQDFLPNSVLTAAKGFPTYYFVCANEYTEITRQLDLKNIGMMLLFLLLYFTLGVYFTKLNRVQEKIEFAQN